MEKLVELHLRNFDKTELSIILGPKVVRAFYREALVNESVICRVVVHQGQVAAFSSVFINYSQFERSMKWKSTLSLINFIAANALRLRFILIYRAVRTAFSKKLKPRIPREIYNGHIGSIVIDKKYRGDIGVLRAFREIFLENTAIVFRMYPGAWTSIRLSNRGSIKFGNAIGLNIESKFKSYPEDLAILYKFKPPSEENGAN